MTTISYPKLFTAKKFHHECNFCGSPIGKGIKYYRSTHKHEGEFYVWKSHEYCSDIASKLDMYSRTDEGVNDEFFQEDIRNEYANIMSKHYNDEYEAKGFIIPKFYEQLLFVLKHHKIESATPLLTHK